MPFAHARVAASIVCAIIAATSPATAGEAEADIEARLTNALAVAEAREGKASPYLLPAIEELAQWRHREGRLGDAAALRRRALDIAVAAFGCDAPSAAEAMAALALLDIDRRRYLDAEPLLIIAERALRRRVAADHPVMPTIYAGLARIALARGDAGPAQGWARRAVELAGRNPHRRSTEPLRSLGAALSAAQRYDEAEPVLLAALTQDRRHFGAAGSETARSLAELGNLYLRRGWAADALPLFERAAAIDRRRLGPAHPFIADDLYDLGLAYAVLGRDAAARDAFLAAVDTLERGTGRDTVRVGYVQLELARTYRRQGREAEAEAAHRDARRILNKAEAEEHRRERRA
jgi:hypothetical protein